jgi:hypothetical protein
LRTRICEGNRKAWCSEKSDAEKGRKEEVEVEVEKGLLWRVGQKAEKKGREGSGSTGVFNPENPAAKQANWERPRPVGWSENAQRSITGYNPEPEARNHQKPPLLD